MTKPVIGIVATHSPLQKINHPDRIVTHISDEIRQAILDNDAIAIGILPPQHSINFIGSGDQLEELSQTAHDILIDQLGLCDGIVFQGGKRTDDFAYHIARIAYTEKIPALGVCSGQTIMANIFEDTEMTYVNPLLHDDPTAEYMHETSIDTSSAFYQIVRHEILTVNSRHTHAVLSCPQLRIAATSINSERGGRHIEVLEAPDRFYLSTRFHPESLYTRNKSMNAIFQAFIRAANEYHYSPHHL